MVYIIVPAIIVKSQSELDEMLGRIEGEAERVMLDLMDGRFVPNSSLEFDFELPSGFEYEAHMMVMDPEGYIDRLEGRVQWAILHFETLDDPSGTIRRFKDRGFSVSLASNPDTSLEEVLPYLDDVDGVLVLTVNPGKYGAQFRPDALEKVRRLRDMGMSISIEVDGGINSETIVVARDAGADVFASGSFILKSDDAGERIRMLREALAS